MLLTAVDSCSREREQQAQQQVQRAGAPQDAAAPCFRHSGGASAFRALSRRAPSGGPPAAAAAPPQQPLARSLAGAAPAPLPCDADAAALRALLSGGDPAALLAGADPGTRLRLAEQLLEVRGALRARLERRRAQLAAATAVASGGGCRCAPHACAPAAADAAALRSARSLLARYPL
jgi:hypothetical protein